MALRMGPEYKKTSLVWCEIIKFKFSIVLMLNLAVVIGRPIMH